MTKKKVVVRVSKQALKLYRELADRVSALVEDGVLEESVIPSSEYWELVDVLSKVAAADPAE